MKQAAFTKPPLSGDQLRAIRESLNLTLAEMGTAFGYGGSYSTRARQVGKFERGERAIPATVANLARAYAVLHKKTGLLPQDIL